MSLIDKVEISDNPAYDFMASMFRLNCNEKMRGEDLSNGVKDNQEINSWVVKTRAKLTKDIQGLLDMFFNFETYYGVCLIPVIPLYNPIDIPDFIKILNDIPSAVLLGKFIGTGYGVSDEPVPLPIIEEMIKDEKKAVSFINSDIMIPSKYKWQLLEFFMKPEEMKKNLIMLLRWYYENIYIHDMIDFGQIIKNQEQDIREKIEKYKDEYIELLGNSRYTKNTRVDKIYIAVSYFYESCTLRSDNIFKGKYIELYLLGYKYQKEVIEKRHYLLSGVQVFKTLADETRLNILKLIFKKPCYGREIAHKLNLSNSTVSHHMSLLVASGIATSEVDENRLYYRVEADKIKELLNDSIDKLLK